MKAQQPSPWYFGVIDVMMRMMMMMNKLKKYIKIDFAVLFNEYAHKKLSPVTLVVF